MIVGYKLQCKGLKEPMLVKGDSFDECLVKFRDYYDYDYAVDTHELTFVESITVNFDIE